ncbi:hypothetical protein LOZ80_34145 [Paenibacillus sp. HWE-109]|uniref:hypothetical protein n=1 Tax=Paenibacillus sp. HWE-109 TaxID=1306526 RepID=UPI001EDF5966|nr:hypothetical protein [Paenibacillus sp. HWE-109]UKS26505.1 hypothetical protein LOZ80_34145 [Paenibacillus sp. HWE-109]
MNQTIFTKRKFQAYWLFNLLLGIPTPYAVIYMIFGFYGFMARPTNQERYMAIAAFCVYVLVWFIGNSIVLRKEDRGTRLGMLVLSVLPLTISAYISFKIMAVISS